MNYATNRAELYKALKTTNSNRVYLLGTWASINLMDLLANPACDWVTVVTRDGFDYTFHIPHLFISNN